MNELSKRCGYVALLGAPNAGKSTLLNQLVGQKLAIVTPKAQTTRSRITGAVIEGQSQIIFVDVPGVFQAGSTKKLEQAMVNCAWQGAADADIVAVMVDAKRGLTDDVALILERVQALAAHKPCVLVLNKTDIVDKGQLLVLTQALSQQVEFSQVFYISALKGEGLEPFRDYVAQSLPAGEWLYDAEHLTDIPARVLASEITREKLFMALREELPYSIAVQTESWEEKRDGSLKISQVIFVERESQKAIILGAKGQMLKKVGQQAREEISHLWGVTAHLFLFVKVQENWKNSNESYDYLGLKN